MIVGVCGFGSTGSGAVMDYLREFEEISTGKNMELSFLYDPHGVLDLEYNLVTNPIRFYSSDAAIKEFKRLIYSYDLKRYVKKYMLLSDFYAISNRYIKKITKKTYVGCLWHYDRRNVGKICYFFKYYLGNKYLRIYDKLGIKQPKYFFNDKMFFGIHDNLFYEATKLFTKELIEKMCGTNKIIALDQPFPSNNPECCFKLFSQNCKAIVVNRDPRDLYILSKQNTRGWELRFTPTRCVEDFILYYKDQMEVTKKEGLDVLYLQFEDMIYNYENTTKKIQDFLEVTKHISPKKFFNPAVSIANTQLILRYPEELENIKKIEKELLEYLYPFDEEKADLSVATWMFEPGEKK